MSLPVTKEFHLVDIRIFIVLLTLAFPVPCHVVVAVLFIPGFISMLILSPSTILIFAVRLPYGKESRAAPLTDWTY